MRIIIDNIVFNNIFVKSISRNIEQVQGNHSGILLTGERFFDVTHAYYNYNITINPFTMSPEQYDELIEILKKPKNERSITLPYGQKNITIKGNISSISDNCLKITEAQRVWGDLQIAIRGVEEVGDI